VTVRGQLVLGEEGGGGLRHVHVHICTYAYCDVWADLLYSLLDIPLYIKLLYKAEHRCMYKALYIGSDINCQ
jgi:hypothetical protein